MIRVTRNLVSRKERTYDEIIRNWRAGSTRRGYDA